MSDQNTPRPDDEKLNHELKELFRRIQAEPISDELKELAQILQERLRAKARDTQRNTG
jgi:hypothetical protein